MTGARSSSGSSVPPRMIPSTWSRSRRRVISATNSVARLVAEVALEQLVHVARVNPRALRLVGRDDVDVVAREDGRVELGLHREPRAEEEETTEPAPFGFGGADFDDAEQRHRRRGRELVEHHVRRIRRHRDEVHARTA